MNSDLFDLLLESSENDILNATILFESQMYYFSYQMYVQALKKMLNVMHSHINDMHCKDSNDMNIECWGKGHVPEEIINDIQEIKKRSTLINENMEIDILKYEVVEVSKKVSYIFRLTKDLLMGKNIRLS